jgi:Glycosyl transferase family 2
MKLIATMPVRNEAWVIGLSARVALLWNDALVILNHGSTDGTVDIIAELQAEFPGRVHCESVPTDRWDEMDHRQMMLEGARRVGATHISIVDADEIITSTIDMTLGDDRPNHDSMVTLPLYNMRGTLTRYHASGMWARRETSVSFQDDPRLHWKASDQFGAKSYQHHRREPQGFRFEACRPVKHGEGGIMHLWGVTERRLIAKHALYKMRDRIRHPEMDPTAINRMYNQAVFGRPGIESPVDWQYAEAPADWWAGYADWMKYLDLKAEPWQEAECRRMIDWYGWEPFKELDLFGVVS